MNIFRLIYVLLGSVVVNQRIPEIHYDIEVGNIRFVESNQDDVDFINKCRLLGLNKDTVFKRKESVTDADGDKITGIVRMLRSGYGDKIWIERGNKIYENIDPYFQYGEYPKYSIGDIVNGTYYKGGMITKYLSNGSYEITFLDGKKIQASIKSITGASNKLLNLDVPEYRGSYGQFSDWLEKSGISVYPARKTGIYTEIEFRLHRILEGLIRIYGNSASVAYRLNGKSYAFTATSFDDFVDKMENRLALYLRD